MIDNVLIVKSNIVKLDEVERQLIDVNNLSSFIYIDVRVFDTQPKHMFCHSRV